MADINFIFCIGNHYNFFNRRYSLYNLGRIGKRIKSLPFIEITISCE
ncbi:hypothetical protein ES703_86545 [subsurface metagenome]